MDGSVNTGKQIKPFAFLIILLVAGMGNSFSTSLQADDTTAQDSAFAKEEETAKAFVQEHHAELVTLLEQLKKMSTSSYEEAIRDLNKNSQRLAGLKERSSDRYEPELSLWKLNSRIQLLVARNASNTDKELREEVLSLLKERNALRVKLLKMEKESLETRLTRVEGQIENLKTNADSAANNELNRLLGTAKTRPATPAKTPPKKKTEASKTEASKPAAAAKKTEKKTSAKPAAPQDKKPQAKPKTPPSKDPPSKKD